MPFLQHQSLKVTRVSGHDLCEMQLQVLLDVHVLSRRPQKMVQNLPRYPVLTKAQHLAHGPFHPFLTSGTGCRSSSLLLLHPGDLGASNVKSSRSKIRLLTQLSRLFLLHTLRAADQPDIRYAFRPHFDSHCYHTALHPLNYLFGPNLHRRLQNARLTKSFLLIFSFP